MFNTMRYHFLEKIDVCQVYGSGCAGAYRCRYRVFLSFFIIIYYGS